MPHLGGGFLGGHEQHELVVRPVGQEQGHRIGLIEAGEIPEVGVLAERPFTVGVMGHQRRRRDHRRHPAQLLQETRPPLGVNGGRQRRRHRGQGLGGTSVEQPNGPLRCESWCVANGPGICMNWDPYDLVSGTRDL